MFPQCSGLSVRETAYNDSMPNTPTTSFIPKQGPVKRTKQTATRQIHLFAVISYVAFIASLLAAVGVFLYEGYVERQREEEVRSLDTEIKGFSDADMERVREFNGRLWQTEDRLNKSVSMTSVFEALEAATVKSVMVEQLTLKKEDDATIVLSAQLSTDSFDSSMFQRGVYERNDVIESVDISDLALTPAGTEEGAASGVTFTATLKVPTEGVPVIVTDPNANISEQPSIPEIIPDAASTTEPVDTLETGSTTDFISSNSENI